MLLYLQRSLQEAQGKLEELRKLVKERNKELQRYEAERREHEKEKAEHLLATKELEHKVAKFHKDSREASATVSTLEITDHTHCRYCWTLSNLDTLGQEKASPDFRVDMGCTM